jgi:hypothetical protein
MQLRSTMVIMRMSVLGLLSRDMPGQDTHVRKDGSSCDMAAAPRPNSRVFGGGELSGSIVRSCLRYGRLPRRLRELPGGVHSCGDIRRRTDWRATRRREMDRLALSHPTQTTELRSSRVTADKSFPGWGQFRQRPEEHIQHGQKACALMPVDSELPKCRPLLQPVRLTDNGIQGRCGVQDSRRNGPSRTSVQGCRARSWSRDEPWGEPSCPDQSLCTRHQTDAAPCLSAQIVQCRQGARWPTRHRHSVPGGRHYRPTVRSSECRHQ